MDMYNEYITQKNIFNIGWMVQKSGIYICVPCGYKRAFKVGDILPECFGCMKGKKYDGDDYFSGLGLWELLLEEEKTYKYLFKKVKRTVACWRFFGEKRAAFSAGSIVRMSRYYVCVPCGYKKFLKKDNLFPKCSSCGGQNKIWRLDMS